MKVHVERQALLSALEAVKHVVAKTSHRPILESVLIVADTAAGGLSVSGTNLETSIRADVLGAHWPLGGRTLLPLHKVLPFLKASEAEHVELEVLRWPIEARDAMKASDGTVVARAIVAQSGAVKVSTSDDESLELDVDAVDEFPVLPTSPNLDARFSVSAVDLRIALERVLPSVARDPGRYSMHGVLLERGSAGELNLIGTDGRRLALAPIDVLENLRTSILPAAGQVVVARDAAALLVKLLPKKGEVRTIVCFEPTVGLASFELGTSEAELGTNGLGKITIFARPIDGELPRYRAIIPASVETSVLVLSSEVLQRLKVVSAACSEDSKAIRLIPAGDPGFATRLEAVSAGRKSSAVLRTATITHDGSGRAKDEPKGPDTLALNPDYLKEGIEACDSETVTLTWTRATCPMVVAAGRFKYVLMPITPNA